MQRFSATSAKRNLAIHWVRYWPYSDSTMPSLLTNPILITLLWTSIAAIRCLTRCAESQPTAERRCVDEVVLYSNTVTPDCPQLDSAQLGLYGKHITRQGQTGSHFVSFEFDAQSLSGYNRSSKFGFSSWWFHGLWRLLRETIPCIHYTTYCTSHTQRTWHACPGSR